jgi:hypothetical protein
MIGLAVVVAAAAIGSSAPAMPDGFYEAVKLEPAASYVATKPVQVRCTSDIGYWLIYAREATQRQAFDPEGFADIPNGIAYLSPDVCTALLRKLAHKSASIADMAIGLMTLTHEATHLGTGSRDEGLVECSAIHTLPAVAVRFFGYSYHHAPLRALMAWAWSAHRNLPPDYQTVC